MPHPKFLANLIISCFEKRHPKQKYCCSPKIKHFDAEKIGLTMLLVCSYLTKRPGLRLELRQNSGSVRAGLLKLFVQRPHFETGFTVRPLHR